MTRVLVASSGHKHVLTASQACARVAEGVRLALPGAHVRQLPLADGGEGTIDSLLEAAGGEAVHETVLDPLCRPRPARIGLLADGRTAVVEIAEAAGSALLAPQERQTMVATSYGVGQMIAAAVRLGRKRIVVGLGGCIASDMGMGMAQALGAEFQAGDGRALTPFPGSGFNALSLMQVQGVRLDAVRRALEGVSIEVASDVDIPLLGPHGQAHSFGPQKGASEAEIAWLDQGFTHLAQVLRAHFGAEVDIPLAGAAGGMGAGLMGFLGARLRLGAELMAEMTGLARAMDEADLVIVGEGRLDATTLLRKAPGYAASLAARHGKPVLAVVGTAQPGLSQELFPQVASCFDFNCRMESTDAQQAGEALACVAREAVLAWAGLTTPEHRSAQ